VLLACAQCTIAFDDLRSVLFSGHSDGGIFIRSVRKSLSGAVTTSLLRYLDPAALTTQLPPVSALWYDSAMDRLYTGDRVGICRVVKKATGIAFETTEAGLKLGLNRSADGFDLEDGDAETKSDAMGAGVSSSPSSAAGGGGSGKCWTLEWDHGSVEVASKGGMVLPRFRSSPSQPLVSPLFAAPWLRDTNASKFVSCRVVSCRVVSCRVVSCRVVSCRVVSCRVVSHRTPFLVA
jgi:hypothetical protein